MSGVALKGKWYRTVSNPADATFYECDRHIQRDIRKVSTRRWEATATPYIRTGGSVGMVIRMVPKNPVKHGWFYLAKIMHRPRKKEEA